MYLPLAFSEHVCAGLGGLLAIFVAEGQAIPESSQAPLCVYARVAACLACKGMLGLVGWWMCVCKYG